MNIQRINEIMKSKQLQEVYYNERPVWIQEVKDGIATIGFIDSHAVKDVYIEDLYEGNLYN